MSYLQQFDAQPVMTDATNKQLAALRMTACCRYNIYDTMRSTGKWLTFRMAEATRQTVACCGMRHPATKDGGISTDSCKSIGLYRNGSRRACSMLVLRDYNLRQKLTLIMLVAPTDSFVLESRQKIVQPFTG